jgi:hypothetical protein
MKPEILKSETIYEGKVFDVRVDTIRENGKTHDREMVIHFRQHRHLANFRRRHCRRSFGNIVTRPERNF